MIAALRASAAAVAVAALGAGAVAAESEVDYVVTEGKLSSGDFYRLVSCRAEPGGPCAVEPVAWPAERASHLTVALSEPPSGFPRDLAFRVARAVDAAVAEINGAGAGLHLVRVPRGEDADVTLRLTAAREGEPIVGTGIPGVDGEEIGAAPGHRLVGRPHGAHRRRDRDRLGPAPRGRGLGGARGADPGHGPDDRHPEPLLRGGLGLLRGFQRRHPPRAPGHRGAAPPLPPGDP